MTREKRRLRLAQRQHLLAQVSQRTAMRSLADALAEEARSATLAQRSRDLAAAYATRKGISDGAALAQTAQFAAALGTLANTAEKARADAGLQAAWQIEALGAAQTRAQRQSERLDQAHAELAAVQDRRTLATQAAQPPRKGLARNVQDTVESSEADPPSAASGPVRTVR